jgi:hypothetical protein
MIQLHLWNVVRRNVVRVTSDYSEEIKMYKEGGNSRREGELLCSGGGARRGRMAAKGFSERKESWSVKQQVRRVRRQEVRKGRPKSLERKKKERTEEEKRLKN